MNDITQGSKIHGKSSGEFNRWKRKKHGALRRLKSGEKRERKPKKESEPKKRNIRL